MATCVNCGRENVDVLLKADNAFKEQHLGWCKNCYQKDERQVTNDGINQIKNIFKDLFGKKS